MLLRKFMVYLDDGRDVYKIAVPAENENDAKEYCRGNGEVIAVKDVTEEYPIDEDKVATALRTSGFGDIEVKLITRALHMCGITE